MLSGRRTWTWLRTLIEHLPPESHTMTALRNSMSDEELASASERAEPEQARWSQVEQLLALVADRVARLEYVLIAVNTEKRRQRPDPPEPIARPGAKPPKKKTAPMTEAAAERLFELINGGAA